MQSRSDGFVTLHSGYCVPSTFLHSSSTSAPPAINMPSSESKLSSPVPTPSELGCCSIIGSGGIEGRATSVFTAEVVAAGVSSAVGTDRLGRSGVPISGAAVARDWPLRKEGLAPIESRSDVAATGVAGTSARLGLDLVGCWYCCASKGGRKAFCAAAVWLALVVVLDAEACRRIPMPMRGAGAIARVLSPCEAVGRDVPAFRLCTSISNSSPPFSGARVQSWFFANALAPLWRIGPSIRASGLRGDSTPSFIKLLPFPLLGDLRLGVLPSKPILNVSIACLNSESRPLPLPECPVTGAELGPATEVDPSA